MSEFLNRIDLQRITIKIVNESHKYRFQISGLSSKAIDRWKDENKIDRDSDIYKMLSLISGKLFFLSNKSQEQISEEYKELSNDINHYIAQLKILVK